MKFKVNDAVIIIGNKLCNGGVNKLAFIYAARDKSKNNSYYIVREGHQDWAVDSKDLISADLSKLEKIIYGI